MSKAVLISIHPEWCEKIASGEKTIEVRKTRPKMQAPFKCYIYMTKQKKGEDGWLAAVCAENRCYYGAGSVIGEFVCDRIYDLAPLNHAPDDVEQQACLTREEIVRYLKGVGCGWHISELKIYDKPKDLSEFLKYGYDDALTDWDDLHCIGVKGIDSVEYPPMPKEEDYRITRAPQSWCYVEELT